MQRVAGPTCLPGKRGQVLYTTVDEPVLTEAPELTQGTFRGSRE